MLKIPWPNQVAKLQKLEKLCAKSVQLQDGRVE